MEMLSLSVFLLLTSGMPVLSLKKVVKKISAKGGSLFSSLQLQKSSYLHHKTDLANGLFFFFLTKGLLLDFKDCSFAN